ncbi:MAG: hypothetical protein Ct9H300mP23_12310 [Nitrospinota bacterium]|nr:MAG: hypothetical protein Ct9H300mP23_12310 [Nitrospinota bacterium]
MCNCYMSLHTGCAIYQYLVNVSTTAKGINEISMLIPIIVTLLV